MVIALHVSIDVATLSFVVGTAIPILVALVTKQSASSGVKACANALFAVVAGVLSVYLADAQGEIVSIDVASFVIAIGTAWITSIATHYGLLKPTGVTGTAGIVQSATPQIGIGGGSSHAHQSSASAAPPAEPETAPQCEAEPRGVVRHRDEV